MGKKINTIVFNKGDEVMESLKTWYKENIEGNKVVHINAIGALLDPTVGYIHHDGTYSWKTLKGEWELLNASGTISVDDEGNIIPHVHVTLGNEDMDAKGGHLKESVIAVTFEGVAMIDKRTIANREFDENTKLKLLKIKGYKEKEKCKHKHH